jgi:glycosyltransferase involved in cell wall biosynthesis
MKILIDGDIFSRTNFGGTVRFYKQLIFGLLSQGVSIDLLLHERNKKPKDFGFKKIGIVYSAKSSVKYDIFHGSYYSNYSEVDCKRKIVTVHDMIDELLPKSLAACGSLNSCVNKKKHAVNRADHVVAISNTTKNDLVNIYDCSIKKISVIYHGVEDVFRSRVNAKVSYSELPLNKPYILHVGGREGYKNFIFLLEAYARSGIKEKANLVVVGSQKYFLPEEEVVIKEHGLQKKVILTGYVSDTLLSSIYKESKLLIMPSLYEGFGYPMVEALASETTVACSSAPALIEIGQGIPLVYNANDLDSCINILEIGFEEEHQQRNRLGKKLVSSFTVENMAKAYLKTYLGIIKT